MLYHVSQVYIVTIPLSTFRHLSIESLSSPMLVSSPINTQKVAHTTEVVLDTIHYNIGGCYRGSLPWWNVGTARRTGRLSNLGPDHCHLKNV